MYQKIERKNVHNMTVKKKKGNSIIIHLYV